jgi:hypothetical protein
MRKDKINFIQEDTMITCDKCGKEVPRNNDATVIQAIAMDEPMTMFFCQPRHFMPTEDCEGSPSRAQYIEGQPRDTRGYRYMPEYEEMWRKAYAQAQIEG